jgi:hypothetical protein
MNRQTFVRSLAVFLLVVSSSLVLAFNGTAQEADRVKAITAPATPLPSEAESKGVTKYSFIVYGDTRDRRDGTAFQYEHSLVIDSMLGQIKKQKCTEYPVRFVLQSGEAVVNGREVRQWNVSFVPLINRLTTEGGVPAPCCGESLRI